MSTPPTRLRMLVPVAAVLLAPLAVTACSAADQTPAPAPETTAPPTSAPTLPKGVKAAAIPTTVANSVTDRKNVVMSSCASTGKGWGAGGTATNPTKKDVTYAVTVFFTTTSATTINTAKTNVPVKAGATVKWGAANTFAHPNDMLCVLRGVAAV